MNAPTPPFLPYGRQTIEADDLAAVAEAMQDAYLTTGPKVAVFEEAFAEAVGAPHAVACANGTAALHLASLAAGIGPDDTVIVPAITFLATANAPALCGAEVVFADVDPDTGLMTSDTFREALQRAGNRRVRAVFPVHYGGHTVDMRALTPLADEAEILVIEDACHAVGGASLGDGGEEHPVGSCAQSAMAAFSFHPVKTITTLEGGMVTTRDPALAETMARLRTHGMTRDPALFTVEELAYDPGQATPAPWYYEMAEPGFNYRLTDVQCALGISQVAKLKRFVDRRAEIVGRYHAALAPFAPHVRPMPIAPGSRPGWHLMVALVDFAALGTTRTEVMARLRERGVGTQVHYIPVNRQPHYAARGAPRLPGADRFYERQLSLPLYPTMSDADVDRVVTAIGEVVGR